MLSILIPSRGRPDLCKKAVASAKATADGELEILIYVDDDDPSRVNYEGAIIGQHKESSEAILHLSSLAKGDLMMFGCDDFLWKTKGWDSIFKSRMPAHGLSVLYYMDRPGSAKAINPVFTRKWLEMTGLFPAYFKHFGADTWVIDTARRAGQLVAVKDVLIEHQKVEDDTYRRSRSSGDATYAQKKLDQHMTERQALADKIKHAIASS